MKPNCTELAAQYERGEITFDQFMNTATRQEPYVVPQTKRRGRRLAQRQGQLVTPAAPAEEVVLESNSVCAICGNEAVGFKSLCCEANVITPSEYARRKQRAGLAEVRTVRLTSTSTRVGYTVTVPADGHMGTLKAFGFGENGQPIPEMEPVGLPAPQKFVDDMVAAGWQAQEATEPASQPVSLPAEPTPLQQPLAAQDGPFTAAPGNLKTAAAALAFVTAGNAYFTVRSQKTGTRYTYRVNRADCSRCGKRDCHCWAFPTYFVSLLSGPENTSDYTYLGMVRENMFRLTRASKMQDSSVPVRAFRWVWEHLVRRELPPQTEIWHEGRCGRCGRMLTVPESVAAGIGPECAGRMGL